MLLVVALWRIRDHRLLARYAYTADLAGPVLLALPTCSPEHHRRSTAPDCGFDWAVPHAPGEFAKLLIIVFAAAYMVAKRDLFRTAGRRIFATELPRLRDLAPLLGAWLLPLGVLTLERELGASLLIFGVVLAMTYAGDNADLLGDRRTGIFLVDAWTAYELFGHVRTRVPVWLDPTGGYLGSGYQQSQSLFGLGTRRLFGTGLGIGHPELTNADYITAGLGEELCMTRLAALLALHLLLAGRGFNAALACRDPLDTLLATGLATTIGMQVFIVIGGVTNLIPENRAGRSA